MILSYCDLFDEKRKRHRVKATITTEHSASSYGQPVIVMEDGSALDLMSWVGCNYQVVRASKKELAALERIGLM